MKKTLFIYIINEIWPVFLAGLCVWIVAALATRMLPILDLILNRGVSASHVLGIMLYMLPEVVLFVLPAASLMAVVVAFLRLSGDSEIVALFSSGISLYQLLPPVITYSVIGFLVALATTTLAVPWGTGPWLTWPFALRRPRLIWGSRRGCSASLSKVCVSMWAGFRQDKGP